MRKTLALLAVLVLGSPNAADAQTRPDFSGRWTTEAAGPGRSGDMGSGWGSPITITQDGKPEFQTYRRTVSGSSMKLEFSNVKDG